MSATNQTQSTGLPWSRGRGFRPKGPFQPARRPGSIGSDKPGKSNPVSSSPGNSNPGNSNPGNRNPGNSNPGNCDSNPGNSKPSNSNQRYNQPSNSYQSSGNGSGSSSNSSYQSTNSISSGNQASSGNASSGYNSGARDVRVVDNNMQQQGSNRVPGANQMQYKQNGGVGAGESKGANRSKEEEESIAKYNYKANPSSPLGEPELSLTQGETLWLVRKHVDNDQWLKVRAENGCEGYVPASYVMLLETKPSSLPWLPNTKQEEESLPEAKPVFKPYQSAYNRPTEDSEESSEVASHKYYCKLCDKKLNGPKPYGAHMTSKAHKEEVEFARDNMTTS